MMLSIQRLILSLMGSVLAHSSDFTPSVTDASIVIGSPPVWMIMLLIMVISGIEHGAHVCSP